MNDKDEFKCESCGVPFVKHLGIIGTCAELLRYKRLVADHIGVHGAENVVKIPEALLVAYVQLQRAAESQRMIPYDDPAQMIGEALDAIEQASKP